MNLNYIYNNKNSFFLYTVHSLYNGPFGLGESIIDSNTFYINMGHKLGLNSQSVYYYYYYCSNRVGARSVIERSIIIIERVDCIISILRGKGFNELLYYKN